MVRVPPKLPIFLDSQHSCWPAGPPASVWASRLVTTKTLRRRFFSLAGRLTRSARRLTLHLPQRWPWQNQFSGALARLRALPLSGLTAPLVSTSRRRSDPPSGQTDPSATQTRANPVREGHSLPAPYPDNSAQPWPLRAAIIVSGCLLHAALIPIYWNSGLACSPSLAHQPWCQLQRYIASVDSGLYLAQYAIALSLHAPHQGGMINCRLTTQPS